MNRRVYLAGPIRHTSYQGATGWRDHVGYVLQRAKIESLSPMRGKGYLDTMLPMDLTKTLRPDGSFDHPLSKPAAINGRDRFDVMSSDIIFMNLLGADKVSIGSMIEIGWADAFRKPIILIDEEDSVHNHAMARHAASWIFNDLYEATVNLLKILNVEVRNDDPLFKMVIEPELARLRVRYGRTNELASADGTVS